MICGDSGLKLSLEYAWSKDEAEKRVREWATRDDRVDWSEYQRAFVFRKHREEGEEAALGDFKLMIADIIDGKLTATWGAVSRAYGSLKGARGGVILPAGYQKQALAFIENYRERFEKLREKEKAKEDEGIEGLPATDTEGDEVKVDPKAIEAKEYRLAYLFEAVSLREHLATVEILREGSWKVPEAPGGILTVSRALMEEFLKNFRDKVCGDMLPLDFGHSPDDKAAPGWIKELEITGNGEASMFATLDITSGEAQKNIKDGSLCYISPQLLIGYEDPESGKTYNVIRSAALTNYPLIKNMSPIVCNFEEIKGVRDSQLRQRDHKLYLAEKERDQFRQAGSQLLTALLSERQARLEEKTDRKLEELVRVGRLWPYEIKDTRQILLSGGETAKAHLKLIEQRQPGVDLSQRGKIEPREESPVRQLEKLGEAFDKGDKLPKDQRDKLLKAMNDLAEKYDKKTTGR